MKKETMMELFSLLLLLNLVCLNFVKLSKAKVVIDFRITSHHFCLSPDSLLYTINMVTMKQCVDECAALSECSALNYKRRYELCELHSKLHESLADVSDGLCVYVKRSDIHIKESLIDNCQKCEDDDDFCELHQCGPKFCPALEISNGIIRGNMRTIGSRVEIKCDKDFKERDEVTHATCLSNGSWTHYPDCIPISDYSYIGCYEDKWEQRVLNEKYMSSALLTTEMCWKLCLDLNYMYALTEAGLECFCGNTPRDNQKKPEDECKTPCRGNLSQMCGGNWRGSLYKRNI